MLTYLTLGVAVTLSNSVPLGILYLVLIPFSFLVVAYSFCAKCACRFHSCTHLWLGRLARSLPPRKPGRYTFWDGVGILVFIVTCWAEERDLLIRYGEAYAEYQERTGFLIPRRKKG